MKAAGSFDIEAAAAARTLPFLRFVELRGPAESCVLAPDPVLHEDLSAAEAQASLQQKRQVHALGYYLVDEAVVGHDGLLFVADRLAVATCLVPSYWQEMIGAHGLPIVPSARRVEGTAIVFHSRHYTSYGHFWLDMLPRLALLAQLAPEVISQSTLIIPSDLPAWARGAVTALFGFASARLVEYAPERECLRCERVIVPTLTHCDYHFHPFAKPLFDAIVASVLAAQAPAPPVPALFVSRLAYTRSAEPHGRRLWQAAEIERDLASLGFRVVAPETLGWQEQIALFSQARAVVGEHGSALKNLLFSRPRAVTVSLGYLNDTQAQIAALKQHRLATLMAEAGPDGAGSPVYRVCPERVARLAERALRLAE